MQVVAINNQKTQWKGRTMNTPHKIGRLLVCPALGVLLVAGCAGPTPHSNQPASVAPTTPQRPMEVVTVSTQPSWLLIGGKDVGDSVGGDRVRVSTRLSGIMGFDISCSDPTDPVTITFWSSGRIVYWKGKGEITKTIAGERVLVPLQK